MLEIQTFEAPGGVLPYLFLQDHRAYAQGDIAGLKVATGDQLAETFVSTQKVGEDRKRAAICRRATAHDISAWENRHVESKSKAEPLVAIEFETDVGPYRGPTAERKADVAGFPRKIADQYCTGYMRDGNPVGKVAHFFVDPKKIDRDLDPEPKLEKPRTTPARKTKRRKAALPRSPRTTEVS